VVDAMCEAKGERSARVAKQRLPLFTQVRGNSPKFASTIVHEPLSSAWKSLTKRQRRGDSTQDVAVSNKNAKRRITSSVPRIGAAFCQARAPAVRRGLRGETRSVFGVGFPNHPAAPYPAVHGIKAYASDAGCGASPKPHLITAPSASRDRRQNRQPTRSAPREDFSLAGLKPPVRRESRSQQGSQDGQGCQAGNNGRSKGPSAATATWAATLHHRIIMLLT
jgi:hypothetical protein